MRACLQSLAVVCVTLGVAACSHGAAAATPTAPTATAPTPPQAPTAPPAPTTTSQITLSDDFSGRRLLPDDNWWNEDISAAPVDAQSDAFITFVGRTRTLHPDFGPSPFGIPYAGVGAGEARVPVAFV